MSSAQNDGTSTYIHGTESEEQRRLSRLNDLLNEACLRELNLRGGERILDVGSGLGQFTRKMARAAGEAAYVLGIERAADQLVEAWRQAAAVGESELVEMREGDAQALPLRKEEWGTFDVAHTRFLLEHVPDPLAVVRQMAQAVRPGGRIVLADDDHDVLRLWPEPPGIVALWRAYIDTYVGMGNDPYVGRRLVWLLHAAGAVPIRNNWIFFGSCSGAPAFLEVVENLEKILQGARAPILARGLIEQTAFEQAIAALRSWGQQPDAAFWFSMCWAEGRVRD
jgi:SAM-dependent methyltransferase